MSGTPCPFLAFDADASKRSSRPTDAHGCYAQRPALAIDLGHQTRFCLSGTFSTCPAFVAWAAREAARSIDTAPVPVTVDEWAAGGTGRPGVDPAAIARADAAQQLAPEEVDEVYGGSDPEGSIWAATPVPPPAPTNQADRDRERIIPLHRRRDVEDELPQPPFRIPKFIGGARGAAALVLLIGAVLFAAPSIIKGVGGFIGALTETPAPSATPSPSVDPTPVPTPEPVLYTVQSGDTMAKISAHYQVSIDVILGANPAITDPAKIYVGQQIIIPSVTPDVTASPSPSVAPSPSASS
jgi:hypothetical protein